ncbi:YncE family protein [Frigoriflavimonas asaccharolytica]|uniref:YVTN family beta-propeller protein n=1 Tax=Frigoriflavimonas asaccharolytica TaxID=2735899 RepID=A0A8J8G5L9_9FLAO|nr:YncE family protein [Frigoriflavimonas asaccharolytica]NRS91568.1 YVTN family beta-propeller protein [Frigoriflavimonas asaccharolytica]
MKKVLLSVLSIVMFSAFLVSCNSTEDEIIAPPKVFEENVLIANRNAGSVSFLDAKTNQVLKTLSIPGAAPMYVVYVPTKDKLYVGDAFQNKVHIINPKTKEVESSINVGVGVFHMWADGLGKQLWVVNDVDKTISVIDLNSNTVVQTINVGFVPHDVFLNSDGTKAYVSILDFNPSMPDRVFMYSTSTFAKTGEVNVGKDPHLYALPSTNKLYVPCQVSNQFYTLNANDFSLISTTTLVGAHGIIPSPSQSTLFVTNFTGSQVYSINSANSALNGSAVSTLSAIPHNVVVNEAGNKMFVTHSGSMSNTVSTYTINGNIITPETTITTNTNPFGLAYYKREVN